MSRSTRRGSAGSRNGERGVVPVVAPAGARLSRDHLITPVVGRWLEDGRRDPEGFWARAARELPWFRTWDKAFEWTPPTFRWFIGAETNLAWNALDHHVAHGRGGQAALVYVNERGARAVYTYAQDRKS